MKEQLDMFSSAETLRDAALDQVLHNAGEWYPAAFAQAMRVICERAGQEKTGEQLRLLVYRVTGPPPNHHNAWGGVVRELKRHHQLTQIGWTHMMTPRSHARLTPLYRLTPK